MEKKGKLNISKDWVEETFKETLGMRFKITDHLFHGVSEFQQVDVVQTESYGKMLLNDGLVMATERDEFVYHDMITHVPLFTHPNPKRVLIIGGGDGGTAREVLRHTCVEYCHMVEIDAMVVDACKEHMPQLSSQMVNNKRFQLEIADGVEFMKTTKQKFDVVLVDSTDPIGPAAPLFGKEFYQDIFKVLNDDGIVVAQGESPFYLQEEQKSLLSIMASLFSKVGLYNFNNMTYPGSLWSFAYASKGLHPINDFDPERVQNSKLQFNYYNKEIHSAAFSLPSFMGYTNEWTNL